MQKKHSKQEDITTELVSTVGCSLVLLPTTLVSIISLVIFGIGIFRWYFLGDTSSVDIYRGLTFVFVVAIIVPALFFYLWGMWKNIGMLYSIVTRYRTMRQEKARIERLIKSEIVQDHQSETLLRYTEDETYKEVGDGKR